jgi:hypothetical protein
MVRSCIPNFCEKLTRLFLSYTTPTPSPEILQQQACDLSTIPYSSWKPPACPWKCAGKCSHLPSGNEARVHGQSAAVTPKPSLHLLSRKDKVTFGGSVQKRTTANDDLGASARTPPYVTAKDAHGGTASCVSLTRSHRMASQGAPEAVYHGPADDGVMTAAAPPAHRRRPRARLEIAPAVANVFMLDRCEDVDVEQDPFDDIFELSSLLDEDEYSAANPPQKPHTAAPVVASCSLDRGGGGSSDSTISPSKSENALASPEASIAAPRVVEKEDSEDTSLGHVFFF